MNTLDKVIAGLTVVVAGLGGYIAGQANYGLKVFERGEKKPAVIREYNFGQDHIYVQEFLSDTGSPRRYIPLSKYLSGIEDEGERKTEKASILNVVSWYD